RAAGITARLADVDYASTGTRLLLEINRPEGASARTGYYYRPLSDDEIYLAGFADVAKIEVSIIGTTTEKVDRFEYRVGQVLSPEQTLVFEIQSLCPAEQQNATCVAGPWRFEWIPGPDSLDSVDILIPVDETHSDGIM